ncbi:proton channel OTOP2-like isoform X2 [Hyla sarda]|uniref:proton channel OTOP2-like isoform X2 n=1 Tax=Hyla sarda TaxID=327740 RepID=UPI0024C43F07|nr:proton channel OTOP2-like isoform X2 [Hyla sarda]
MGISESAQQDLEVPPINQSQEVTIPNAVHDVSLPQADSGGRDGTMAQTDLPVQSQIQGNHQDNHQVPSDIWKKGGRLLSALLAINVGLIACVLVSSGTLEEVSVKDTEVLAFLVILMLLSTVWMIFQFYFSCRKNAVLYKDSHAGPVWLRGGLVFFGICSLVLDVFKIGYYISYIDCESPIKLIHPMVQSAFIILQTYFLWVSSKHCVQIHTNISRYGLMLVLITNLSIWMAAVTDESVHQTRDLEEDFKDMAITMGYHDQRDAGGAHGHTCRCSNHLCHIFQTGYYYLYPFNIEYSLFASAMTYVMWKNVGRKMDDTMPCHRRLSPCFCFHSIFVGLIFGGIVLLGGIVALVTYKVQVNIRAKSHQAHVMFYSFNVVVLSIMSMGSLTGSIIYRFDKRDMDGHKNPTRTLDVTLLLGAALGLHREPFRDSSSDPNKELVYTNESVTPSLPEETCQEPAVPSGTNTVDNHMQMDQIRPWNLKRRLVQEISLFLLLCNIILWLMPAFGARPQLKNNLELKFYGPTVWTIITNISLPFGIFYRMHGAASLLEVFRMS